ncbi:hypothetical protein Hamer_G020852 [Homarus americanus]|uniref:Uncharacterized protein n=2 Tax=Homarus americanus TaxID=6706 RepID=A0A8J5MQJ7_HOMAM|nr:hypothetical protein Hamer_G020852 [Homarus americanus]
MLERLAERGIKLAERESMAEELLSRLEHHHLASTTTEPPQFRHKRDHLGSFLRDSHSSHHQQRTPSHLLQEQPVYPEMLPYSEAYSELEELVDDTRQDVARIEEVIAEVEEEEVSRAVQHQFLVAGLLDQMRDKRQTSRPSREERRQARQRRREERQRRREEKKGKRNEKKRKKRLKLPPGVESLIRDSTIELHDEDGEKFIDCCPTKRIFVKKMVGKARDNRAMDIEENHQQFEEHVCLEEYEGKECIFPVKALKRGTVTRCVQQYSYSQALTRPYQSNKDWKYGYVQTRSGCSCQVSVKRKNKKKKRKR